VKNYWLLSSLLSSLSALLISSPAEAAKLESWQFNPAQNRLTFTTDEPVQPRVQLLSDPARLVIDLPDTSLERRREDESFDDPFDEVEVRREDDNVARIVIELDDDYSIDPAQVLVRGTSTTGWTVQLPTPQPIRGRRSNRDDAAIPISVTPFVEAATIQAVELDPSRNQVIIRADRAVQDYTSGWDQSTATYQIRIPNARLDRSVTSSAFDPRSPLLRLQVRQQADTVIVALQPAPGVQVGDLTQSEQTLSLALVGRQQRRFTANAARTLTLPPLNQLPNVSRQRVLIALDPGHGGRDPGAVGIGGLRETDIVLEVGLRVAELLQQHGAEVLLTRTDEREIGLEPRVLVANRANADLFVSIHANAISMSRPDVNGVETYFYSSVAAENLATYLQESMLEATNMNSRGVKEARFYVLRRTTMPAALVEVGFVTGATDAPLLADSAFRDIIAQAITRGILQYVVDNL
jgi:N-acetylmuramoyl-L-alanine amidase